MTPETDPLEERIAAIYAVRDRERMAPTIAAFEALLAEHPDSARAVYEVAGAYDTAGQEARARPLYERAIELGLAGDALRRCLVQYGSTLRNLGELDASLAVLDRADREFPGSATVAVFRSLTLLESGRADAAVGTLLTVIAAEVDGDLGRHRAAVSGNAGYLLARDGLTTGGSG